MPHTMVTCRCLCAKRMRSRSAFLRVPAFGKVCYELYRIDRGCLAAGITCRFPYLAVIHIYGQACFDM